MELVPKYVSAVPATAMGLLRSHPYQYSGGGSGYRIRFESLNFVICERGPGGSWRCDD
jgi:hypothetical protein